ncbi:hypothetical protein WQ54_15480 [Bacillus sp. SA1-12]|uniref:DUF624 domain-containing protein n=1 Tax=Bacillus sp. SA1-12 TaxID=1455638 RepID=UPI000626F094|nr:DUF624 domain-containing protein [Bacillus sp. SA1-12]KKI91343.1 hypothetical protein WQ54_15480 [Bacillus sp. SA1-12]
MLKHFIDSNSKLYKFSSYLMDLFTLNLLFLLTSLPIITIGSSTLALYRVTMKMAEGKLNFPTKTYFLEFKDNFIRGNTIGLILILYGSLLVVAIRLLQILPIISFIIVGIGILIALITFVVFCLFIFPYTARYENSLFGSFRVVLQVSSLNPKITLGLLIFLIAMVAIISLDSFWLIFVSFFFFMVGFATVSLGISHIALKLFTPYE